ncbi:hypothetical protein ACHAWF_000244 [Thalassiosira exigua]
MVQVVERHVDPMEDAMRTRFIPTVLDLDSPIDDEWRRLLGNSTKQGGLAIRNPLEYVPCLHQALKNATTLLVDVLVDKAELSLLRHKECIQDATKGFRQVRIEEEFGVWTGIGTRRGPKV